MNLNLNLIGYTFNYTYVITLIEEKCINKLAVYVNVNYCNLK